MVGVFYRVNVDVETKSPGSRGPTFFVPLVKHSEKCVLTKRFESIRMPAAIHRNVISVLKHCLASGLLLVVHWVSAKTASYE
jgi:hypothetical protein